ncbi:T9SS type A sorting domain-containing protein [Aequorivita sp. 609]|nr:T9SS type A sorting domain-containing protein [Aequorivita sp. 609]
MALLKLTYNYLKTKKMRFKLLLLFTLLFSSLAIQAQEYLRMIDAGTYKVQDIIDSAEAHFEGKDKGRGTGYKQYKRWEYNALRMVQDDGYLASNADRLRELENWNAYVNSTAENRMVLPDSWQEMGPDNWNATSGWNPGVGRITSVAIEEGNENHIIVGANTGGVWKTTDGAQTWTPLNDYFSNMKVYAVAMDPTDANTYFFGATNGDIFKSTDAGATWSLLATIGNSVVNRILIHPTNSDIMFATAENVGIYATIDGGTTWTTAVSDSRGYDLEFKPGDPSVVYASGTGFHKSTDGGATFTTIGGFNTGPKMIGVSAANPEAVYVVEAFQNRFGGFYSSVDGGNTFTKLNHGNKNYFGYSTTGNDNNGQAPRDMAIAVNPSNANEVHIAGILSWRSMDAGVTFEITSDWIPANAATQNIGYCHADIDDMLFHGTTLYAVTDGGIFKAENTATINASYFEDLTEGLGIRQFYKIGISQTEDVVVSGGSQDNGTSFYTSSTGWRDWIGADGMETFIDKDNTNFMYGTSQFGQLYRTQNGGNSLIQINEPGTGSGNWVTPFEQDPIVQNSIYVGYNRVYKSANLGASWTPVSQNFGGNLNNLKIYERNNQIMYASRGALMYRTTDGGATDWEQVGIPGGLINSIAIHPVDPNKIAVATTSANKVMVSEDGGDTWSSYNLNLPNFSALAVVWQNNSKDGLYLGMDYGIYYIDNTFTEWQPFSNLLPNVQINELEINYENGMIYAGSYGRGLWVSPVVEGTMGVNKNTFESTVSVYPNPADSQITIGLQNPINAEIRIFDISGKLLMYQADAFIANKYTMDVSSLNSGVYFVRLNTTAGTAIKKLVIN